MTQSFEDRVSSIIKNYKNSCFLTAVSGGADSMSLLCALAALREPLYVLHVEHGLRGQESKDDAEFVRAFCEERKIPCIVVSIPPGKVETFARSRRIGIEAAARHFRRRVLLREAKRLDLQSPVPSPRSLILTAHTRDDALELALMRLLRGAGPAGLAMMPVKRGRFLRPLLGVTRTEVIAYLKENNIPWREDSTNKDERFLRNKIRHRLIPVLDEAFLSWKKGIENVSVTQELAAEFIINEAKKRILWGQGSGAPSNGTRKGVDKKSYMARAQDEVTLIEKVRERQRPIVRRGQGSVITDENNFFSQPQIIREEAIFQGILSLRLCGFARGIKRYVVRKFCAGEAKTIDLGFAKITRKDGKIALFPAQNEYFEKGILRLIN